MKLVSGSEKVRKINKERRKVNSKAKQRKQKSKSKTSVGE